MKFGKYLVTQYRCLPTFFLVTLYTFIILLLNITWFVFLSIHVKDIFESSRIAKPCTIFIFYEASLRFNYKNLCYR